MGAGCRASRILVQGLISGQQRHYQTRLHRGQVPRTCTDGRTVVFPLQLTTTLVQHAPCTDLCCTFCTGRSHHRRKPCLWFYGRPDTEALSIPILRTSGCGRYYFVRGLVLPRIRNTSLCHDTNNGRTIFSRKHTLFLEIRCRCG